MSSAFSDTRWSLVELARGESEIAQVALSELCAAYYAPVQSFVHTWCRDEDRAKDLTQDFFARVLAERSLESACAGKGRFRSYLLGAVKHYLCSAADPQRSQRRGGGMTHETLAPDADILDERTLPPDVVFDQQWALAALARTLERLRQTLEAEGQATLFSELKPWLAGQADHGQTAIAARALGKSETAVRILLHRLRLRFRDMLRAELAQTLSAQGDVDTEMRHLLMALRK